MCFSTQASFVAGIVLAATGLVAMTRAKERYFLFSTIPFIFAIQQISEGFLWLSSENIHYLEWKDPAKYIFLFFAQVVWPIWIPFSVYQFEKNPFRKKCTKFALFIGIIISTYNAFCLFSFPSDATVSENHFHYVIEQPFHTYYINGVMYFIPTVITLLISSVKSVRILGLFIFASYCASWFFFNEYVLSIWCFFAAIISIMIVYIVRGVNDSTEQTV